MICPGAKCEIKVAREIGVVLIEYKRASLDWLVLEEGSSVEKMPYQTNIWATL